MRSPGEVAGSESQTAAGGSRIRDGAGLMASFLTFHLPGGRASVPMQWFRMGGIPALLGVACILLGGCGTEAPTSPDEFQASWDSLQFFPASPADTLLVGGDGSLEYRSDETPARPPLAGVIAAGTLRSLEQAVAAAELDPWQPAGGPAGAVVIRRGAEVVGFSWQNPEQLNAANQRVVDLLDGIVQGARSEAAGNELISEWISTRVVLKGGQARARERGARVIRDADALLLVMREWLGTDPVVMPEIDFDHEMLLAVFAGEQPAGSELGVDQRASSMIGGYLRVPVTLHVPHEACAGPGQASPYEIVRLRKMDLEVFFSWDVVEFDCLGER